MVDKVAKPYTGKMAMHPLIFSKKHKKALPDLIAAFFFIGWKLHEVNTVKKKTYSSKLLT
jgi:hypothetical protein